MADGATPASRFAPCVPGDPGCGNRDGARENPQCQDGLDNDWMTGIDFDGGASLHGVPIAAPDPQCADRPWWDREAKACGLGAEIAGLALVVKRLQRRVQGTSRGAAAS